VLDRYPAGKQQMHLLCGPNYVQSDRSSVTCTPVIKLNKGDHTSHGRGGDDLCLTLRPASDEDTCVFRRRLVPNVSVI
jgi:hypothetical protein